MLHDFSHKLSCHIPGGMNQHRIKRLGLHSHDLSHGIDQQLFLKDQNDLLLSFLFSRPVDQIVVDSFAEFLPVIGIADHPRI